MGLQDDVPMMTRIVSFTCWKDDANLSHSGTVVLSRIFVKRLDSCERKIDWACCLFQPVPSGGKQLSIWVAGI